MRPSAKKRQEQGKYSLPVDANDNETLTGVVEGQSPPTLGPIIDFPTHFTPNTDL